MKEVQRDEGKTTEVRAKTVRVADDAGKRLTVWICDDEKEHIEQLQQLLKGIDTENRFRIITSTQPESLLSELIHRTENGESLPDVMFLDIRMPGVDGIAFGKELRNVAPDVYVVFTTAYQEYAVEGYEARAFRYLLKPLQKETLQKVIKEIQGDMGRRKKLIIKLAEEERILSLNEIIYLGAEDKYTVLYTADGYFVDRTSLTEYEQMLKPYGFFRIHRKYIVNFHHHKAIGKGYVTLSCGFRLPISRRRGAAYYTELFDGLGKELVL